VSSGEVRGASGPASSMAEYEICGAAGRREKGWADPD